MFDEILTLEEVLNRAEKIHVKFNVPMQQSDIEYLKNQHKHVIESGRSVKVHWVEGVYAVYVFRRTEQYRNMAQKYRSAYTQMCEEGRAVNPHANFPSLEATYGPKLKDYINQHVVCPCAFCVDQLRKEGKRKC